MTPLFQLTLLESKCGLTMMRAKFQHSGTISMRARLKQLLSRWPQILSVVRKVRSALSPEARAIRRLQRHQGEYLLQPFATTKADRHPALFAFAKDRLAGKNDLRILSFGCSTGEEPLSLLHYFPDVMIDAIDINPRSIAIARRNAAAKAAGRIIFSVGTHPPDVPAHYDAIFCLSVLRHGHLDAHQPLSCSGIFPFSKFDATVTALDLTLCPGGLLFIWGSNFHFSDCAVADRYRPLDVPGTRRQAGAFYGPDDALLKGGRAQSFAFEKLRPSGAGHATNALEIAEKPW